MNVTEHTRRQQWNAFSQLAEHDLLAEEYWDDGKGARWVIGKAGTFVGRCEIIAGIGGSLIVHGDYDLCRFAHYGDRSDAWSRLRWMADSRDLDYYVAQKAAIGLTPRDVEEYDEDVAKAELEVRLADLKAEAEPNAEMVCLVEEALAARYITETHEQLHQFLNERDKGWGLWEWRVGRVLAFRVVMSHAVLNKCVWLLRERHGDAGPAQCRRRTEAA